MFQTLGETGAAPFRAALLRTRWRLNRRAQTKRQDRAACSFTARGCCPKRHGFPATRRGREDEAIELQRLRGDAGCATRRASAPPNRHDAGSAPRLRAGWHAAAHRRETAMINRQPDDGAPLGTAQDVGTTRSPGAMVRAFRLASVGSPASGASACQASAVLHSDAAQTAHLVPSTVRPTRSPRRHSCRPDRWPGRC